MKKLIALLSVLLICSIVSAKNKDVVCNKDTGEIIGVAIQATPTKDADRINIKCEGDVVIYGVKTDKVVTVSVDEKIIPSDVSTTQYKVDTNTKEIYQEVILEEVKWKNY